MNITWRGDLKKKSTLNQKSYKLLKYISLYKNNYISFQYKHALFSEFRHILFNLEQNWENVFNLENEIMNKEK